MNNPRHDIGLGPQDLIGHLHIYDESGYIFHNLHNLRYNRGNTTHLTIK